MAENAGTIYAEIRIEFEKFKADKEKAQEYIANLEANLKTSIAEAGKDAGTGFFAGIKKGFKQTSEEAKKLGSNIVKSISPVLIAITAGIKALKGIGSAIHDAFMSNEQFRDGVENLKSALGEGFAAAVRPVSNFFAGLIDNATKSIKQTNDLRNALKRLKDEMPDYGDTIDKELENAQKDFNALNAEADKLRENWTCPR